MVGRGVQDLTDVGGETRGGEEGGDAFGGRRSLRRGFEEDGVAGKESWEDAIGLNEVCRRSAHHFIGIETSGADKGTVRDDLVTVPGRKASENGRTFQAEMMRTTPSASLLM